MISPCRVANRCVFGSLQVALLLTLISSPMLTAQSGMEMLKLSVLPRDPHGWIQLRGRAVESNTVVTINASSNLVNWRPIAVLHATDFDFFDPVSSSLNQRFYRFTVAPIVATNDWKNQIANAYELFSRATGSERWVKFAITMADPTRVLYADANRYTFHYDLVAARLEPFVGISPAEFDQISQFNAQRELVIGTVLYPSPLVREYGIQFVSHDPLPRELVRDLFELVRSTVVPEVFGDPVAQAFYVPTFEQVAVTQMERDFFASNGIPVTSADRWVGGDVCYSKGWALGTLKFFSATNVPSAYANGQLLPWDILITDGIPAELPYVSGIITLTPTTANSHVAILAQSYGVPFAYLVSEAERARVLQLTNREIVLQSGDLYYDGGCLVVVQPVEPPLDAATMAALSALKTGPAFKVAPKERYGAYTMATDNLIPADIKFFGGKAANYGLLRRIIPTNSLPAIAVSFDLWDDFMQQILGNGKTLRQEISNRLAGFTYPPNVAALQTQLASIRSLIRNSTQFTASQQSAITNALSVFDRQRNIRFRSSTNVEDAESFTGAGLYDSYSGCLADDQDSDTEGPSICDPTEEDERGVFRAIRRVFASFYNDNAYLERLRLGVNENEVGMAILVHHSTPDEFEMANGVATGTWQTNGQRFDGRMVSQLGAVSVANPDGTARPEEVGFYAQTNRMPILNPRESSSLVRLGDAVMTWTNDYTRLANLLLEVARGYAAMFTNRASIRLDMEYKKVTPGVLELKQVREIPATTNRYVAPFVVNDPDATFEVWHGFYDNIFLAHRLKSRWTLRHRNVQFTPTNLVHGFYTDLSIEYLNGTNVQTLSGQISSFSNYVHETFTNVWDSLGTIEDRWTMETITDPMDFVLRTAFTVEVPAQSPFSMLPASGGITLDVRFSQPVRDISPYGEIGYFTNTSTRLQRVRAETSNDLFREATFEVVGQGTNILIYSSYWLPSEARGDDCRCPVLRIVESRIEGFTTEPLVLHGYWSQTFNDVHNYGYVQFVFEPRLEQGLSAQQLNELTAANIMQIYVNGNGEFNPPVLMIVGFDGTLRRFSDQDFGPN